VKKTKSKTLRKKNKTFRKKVIKQTVGGGQSTVDDMSRRYTNLPTNLKLYTRNYTKEELQESMNLPVNKNNTIHNDVHLNIHDAIEKSNILKLKQIVNLYYANDILNKHFKYVNSDGEGYSMGYGLTPLLYAITKHFTEGVKTLLAQPGIKVNSVSEFRLTWTEYMFYAPMPYKMICLESALHFAVKTHDKLLVDILCSMPFVNVNLVNSDKKTPLDIANHLINNATDEIKIENIKLIKLLLESRGALSQTDTKNEQKVKESKLKKTSALSVINLEEPPERSEHDQI